MKMKSLAIMSMIAVVLIGGAWLVSQQQARAPVKERLFPGLLAAINDVAELRISSQRGASTILRRGDIWGVKEKHHYPADLGKVRETLLGLAELQILEAKTAKPEWHEKLGVRDVDVEGSVSTGVALKDAAGGTLAEVIVGQTRPAGDQSGHQEMFVRKPGNPQTWLVIGSLSVEPGPSEWLDRDALRIEPKRVKRVSVTHPDRTRLTLKKATPDDLDYQVVDLPEGRDIQSQFTVNNIVSTIASLSFEDVRPKSDVSFDGHAVVVAALETFDGLEGTVTLLQRDEKNYVTVAAAFNPALVWQPEPETPSGQPGDEPKTPPEPKPESEPESKPESEPDAATPEPPAIKPAEDVKAEINTLTRTVSDWVYMIPQFRADTILTKPADLLAPPAS